MNIHPAAVVHADARLHPTVRVAAHAVIDADVEIGEGSSIGAGVRIYSGVRLGRDNEVEAQVVLGGAPQDLRFDRNLRTGVAIGDRNRLFEGVTISRSTRPGQPTRLGHDNFVMGHFHLGHDCEVGDRNILTQGSLLAGHVSVGSGVVISGLVAVHQFCRIGDYAMLSGLSGINQDVPPYVIASGRPAKLAGLNTVGLKRAGFTPQARLAIKHAYRMLSDRRRLLAERILEVKAQSMSPEVQQILAFFESSRRGITRFGRPEERAGKEMD